jgi:HSP20 family protein
VNSDLQRRIVKMADQELQIHEKQEVGPERGELTLEGPYFSPAVDIYNTETELVLLADIPGVRADQVDIDLRDDMLSILGKVPSEGTEGQILLTEYRTGNYFRTFRLTADIDRSKITAAISDGVLKLTLPKSAKAVPRKIPITEG